MVSSEFINLNFIMKNRLAIRTLLRIDKIYHCILLRPYECFRRIIFKNKLKGFEVVAKCVRILFFDD